MIKTIVFVLIAGLWSYNLCAQEIFGKVTNSQTGQPVTGAHIIIEDDQNNQNYAISNANGRYSFKLVHAGKNKLVCTYVGFESITREVEIKEDQKLEINFRLTESVEELQEVTITGDLVCSVKRTGDALYTGTAITPKGIELLGISAKNSIYNTLDLLPAVTVTGQDAYGLAAKEVRIRGIRGLFSGVTIEGFPNYGIMPIGARDDIYDIENMESISLYKGATPTDIGSATGSRGGIIELSYHRPENKLKITLNQAYGSNSYWRSFIRFDCGIFPSKTKFFTSYSYTTANKWKGYGNLALRHNIALGLAQQLSPKMYLELFGNFNTVKRHDFRALIFAEASDIENNFNLDYVKNIRGVPAEDYYYYDYNRGEYTNADAMAIWNYDVSGKMGLITRIYYSREDAVSEKTVNNQSKYIIQDRTRDIGRIGIIPEAKGQTGKFSYSVGYWFESFDNRVYVYPKAITAVGLVPKGYNFYAVPKRRGQIHSPYAKLAYNGEHLKLQTGLKYYYFNGPESERYKSISPDTLSTEPSTDLHTDAIIHSALLPSIGIGYRFSKAFEIYANYGRNYMRPYRYVPTINLYLSNQIAFNNAGMNLQSIFDTWKMETSDNFDFGLRFTTNCLKLTPTVYYSKQKNTLANIYDPIVGVNYYRNVGDLTSIGAELEAYAYPLQNLTLFIHPAYTSISYDKDLERLERNDNDVQNLDISGNQIPATPVWLLKSGGSYTHKFLVAAVFVNYTGERFGDATNTEKIPGFTLVNLSLQFKKREILLAEEAAICFEVKNLFDKRYIGMITVWDDSAGGNATYYAGFPRSIVASAKLTF